MSDSALQPIHVTIKQFGVTDGTEQHVELTVSPDRTLGELFASIAPEHRSARGLTWRFQIGERVLDWAIPLGTLRAEYLTTRHFPGGVLWIDLLYFADRPVGNDFLLRTQGAEPSYGSRSSESNLPTLPDVALPPMAGAPGAPPAPKPAPPRPAAAAPPPVEAAPDWMDSGAHAPIPEPPAARRADEPPRPTRAKRKAMRDDADQLDMSSTGRGRGAPSTERRATVRYYTRMNPDRMFPLLVILSANQVQEVLKARVKQTASAAFNVEEGSMVEVEAVLPGCDCYPPRMPLTVETGGPSTTTIWVVPKVLGRIEGARVLIRQGGRVLAEVPLEIKVAKQTLAVACGLMSLAAPYLTMGLKSLQLDYASQKAGGFPLYQQVGSWLADAVRPEWIGLGFLGLAVGLYFLMRPRKRDVFWDVNLK